MRLTSLQCSYIDPDLPCDYCARQNLECGPKGLASTRYVHTGRDQGHPYAVPEQRSPSLGRSPGAAQQFSFPGPLRDPETWIERSSTQRLSDIVIRLESQNPRMNIFEILRLANQEVASFRGSSSSPQRPVQSRESSSAHNTPPASANPRAQSPIPPFHNSASNTGNQERRPSLQNLTVVQNPPNTSPGSHLISGPTTSNLPEGRHSQGQTSLFQQQQHPQASLGREFSFSSSSNDPQERRQSYQSYQGPPISNPFPQHGQTSSSNDPVYGSNVQSDRRASHQYLSVPPSPLSPRPFEHTQGFAEPSGNHGATLNAPEHSPHTHSTGGGRPTIEGPYSVA